VDIIEVDCGVKWIKGAQDKIQWLDFMVTLMNVGFHNRDFLDLIG